MKATSHALCKARYDTGNTSRLELWFYQWIIYCCLQYLILLHLCLNHSLHRKSKHLLLHLHLCQEDQQFQEGQHYSTPRQSANELFVFSAEEIESLLREQWEGQRSVNLDPPPAQVLTCWVSHLLRVEIHLLESKAASPPLPTSSEPGRITGRSSFPELSTLLSDLGIQVPPPAEGQGLNYICPCIDTSHWVSTCKQVMGTVYTQTQTDGTHRCRYVYWRSRTNRIYGWGSWSNHSCIEP